MFDESYQTHSAVRGRVGLLKRSARERRVTLPQFPTETAREGRGRLGLCSSGHPSDRMLTVRECHGRRNSPPLPLDSRPPVGPRAAGVLLGTAMDLGRLLTFTPVFVVHEVSAAMVHFLYDGWVWKVRSPTVARPLGIAR